MISFLGWTLTIFMTWRLACLKCMYEQMQEKSHMLSDGGYNDLDETYKATVYFCWLNCPEFTNKENYGKHPVPRKNTIKLLHHEVVLWDAENPKSLIILNSSLYSFSPDTNSKQIIKYKAAMVITTRPCSLFWAERAFTKHLFTKINMKEFQLRIMNVLRNEYK